MGMKERTNQRRKRIVAHRATGYQDADRWDLEYWQAKTQQMGLSALTALHRDYEKIKRRKK